MKQDQLRQRINWMLYGEDSSQYACDLNYLCKKLEETDPHAYECLLKQELSDLSQSKSEPVLESEVKNTVVYFPEESEDSLKPVHGTIVNKTPLKKKKGKFRKFLAGLSLAGLALFSTYQWTDYSHIADYVKKSAQTERAKLNQRNSKLEQLLDYQKEILGWPVKVERKLKITDADLYQGTITDIDSRIVTDGAEVKEGDPLYFIADLDLAGLNGRKINYYVDLVPVGIGRVVNVSSTKTISRSGRHRYSIPIEGKVPAGNYNLTFTVREPQSGLAGSKKSSLKISPKHKMNCRQIQAAIMAGAKLDDSGCERLDYSNLKPISVKDLKLCSFLEDQECVGEKYQFPVSNNDISFIFKIENSPSQNNLIKTYRVWGPNGNFVLKNRTNDQDNQDIVRSYIPTKDLSAGNYALDVIIKDPVSGMKTSRLKKFTLY